MVTLGKLWAGRAYGTNTGNLFAEFEDRTDGLGGTLRFNDDRLGVVVFEVQGSYDGNSLRFTGTPTMVPANQVAGTIQAEGTVAANGSIRGRRSSALGSGGIFELFPHDLPNAVPEGTRPPEQVQTATAKVGALSLGLEDLRGLVDVIGREFTTGRAVISYTQEGREILRWAADFLAAEPDRAVVRDLRVMIQEPDNQGGARSATVQLSGQGENTITVQATNETWVLGKLEAVTRYLRSRENRASTYFRRFAGHFGSVLFFGFIAATPSIAELHLRLVFAATMLVLLTALNWIHRHLVPNASITFGSLKTSPGLGGLILSVLVNAAGSMIAAVAFYLLVGSSS
jgi:hypothetical protein